MGLAGAKKKRKVGLDPNNHRWARNTDSFGHKMLRQQGWEPGQFLGAKDAPHAQFHTAASASHIRVVLKEDNMGIGAKRNQGDQCTGLDDLQSILGRLNGKSDAALETERQVRQEVKLSLYMERRFGPMRFVKGGWLVGDQVPPDAEAETANQDAQPDTLLPDAPPADRIEESSPAPAKKRKLEDSSSSESDEEKRPRKRKHGDVPREETEKERRRREKKEKKAKRKEGEGPSGGDEKKKKKKERKDRGAKDEPQPLATDTTEAASDEGSEPTKASTKKSKKEKRSKSRGKREGSESGETEKSSKKKKRKSKAEPIESAVPEAGDDGKPSSEDASTRETPVPKDTSGISTPVDSGHSTPIRNISRRRFIAQKRMAFSDPKALNQIFMIKSQS